MRVVNLFYHSVQSYRKKIGVKIRDVLKTELVLGKNDFYIVISFKNFDFLIVWRFAKNVNKKQKL